jgi:hypothetical protein
MSLEQPPEVHRPHTPHEPRRIHWLELVTSLSALLVSVVSIAVAVQHGNTMQQLVTANSLPYIEIRNSNAVQTGDGGYARAIHLALHNVGVGPADVRYVRLLVNGQPVSNYAEWIGRCCTNVEQARQARMALTSDTLMNQSRTHFIPAGGSAPMFSTRRTELNAAAWELAEGVRLQTVVEACYCSVFDECWTVNSRTDEREEVNACEAADHFVP